MTSNSDTSPSLLIRLRDPADREAWFEFVDIYRPLIYRVARRYGMQDADALNLTQLVLEKVERATSNRATSNPQGRFRSWLTTVARNTAIDAIRRIRPDAAMGGTSIHEQLHAIPDREDESIRDVRRELERAAFRQAARRIHDEFTETTWAAFWETMVNGVSCNQVADQLGLSLGATYTARSRVMARLKQELEHFDWQEAHDHAPEKST